MVRRRQVGLHVALVALVEGVVDLDAGAEVILPEVPGPGEREIQGRHGGEPAGAVALADEILEFVDRRPRKARPPLIDGGEDPLARQTQRAADGLALSSRNGYLSPDERIEAAQLFKALKALGDAARTTPTPDLPALEAQAMQALARRGWKPDYLTVRRRTDLLPPQGPLASEPLVVLGAAKLGNTRLIDNLEI